MPASKDRNSATQRIQHASLAGLVALVLSFLTVFDIVDQFTWVTQSRIANFQASGDVVYVGSRDDLTDPAYPERRAELAETLETLREAGAERVYVDMVFDRPAGDKVDTALNSALKSYDGNAYLVRNMVPGSMAKSRPRPACRRCPAMSPE